MTKKAKRTLMLKPITEIIDHYKEFEDWFKIRLGNYSIQVETLDEKIFFTDVEMGPGAFAFFNIIKSDVGGEIRQMPERVQYFDFGGIKANQGIIDQCYCVDINSAYLTALLNEQVITQDTYQTINEKTRKNEKTKTDRLKAVGMFARNTIEIIYEKGEVSDLSTKENPFAWVFFQACKTTNDAMQAVKKWAKKDYLLYWVDGIFILNNPEEAVRILSSLGFESKIEIITNLEVVDGAVTYLKDGKQKILFLPRNTKADRKEFYGKLNNSTTL